MVRKWWREWLGNGGGNGVLQNIIIIMHYMILHIINFNTVVGLGELRRIIYLPIEYVLTINRSS